MDIYESLFKKIEEIFSAEYKVLEEGRTDAEIREVYSKFFIEEINKLRKENQPFYLYRYCKLNDFLYSSILNKNVYLVGNNELDDVYEGVPVDQMNLYNSNTERILLVEDAFGKRRIGKKYVDNSSAIEKPIPYYYMKSFSASANNMPMWGLYADESKGVCVRYDITKLNDDILKHLFPVFYTKERCANSGYSIDDLRNYSHKDSKNLDLLHLSLYKGDDWKFEQEFRIVYMKYEMAQNDNESMAQELNFDCIDKVYLGFRISKIGEKIMAFLSKDIGFEYEKVKLDDDSFKYCCD